MSVTPGANFIDYLRSSDNTSSLNAIYPLIYNEAYNRISINTASLTTGEVKNNATSTNIHTTATGDSSFNFYNGASGYSDKIKVYALGNGTTTDKEYVSLGYDHPHTNYEIESNYGGAGVKHNLSLIAPQVNIPTTTDSNGLVSGALVVEGGALIKKTIDTTKIKIYSTSAYGAGAGIVLANLPGGNSNGFIGLDANDSMFIGATGGVFFHNNMSVRNDTFPIIFQLADNALTKTANYTMDAGGDLTIQAVGGDINLSSADMIHILNTSASTDFNTGALMVSGGCGIAKDTYVGGRIIGKSTTQATNANSGSLIVSGGLGVAKNTYIGGIERILSTDPSTSLTTGALIVTGGAGITGKIYTGDTLNGTNITLVNGSNALQQLYIYSADSTKNGYLQVTNAGNFNIGTNGTIYMSSSASDAFFNSNYISTNTKVTFDCIMTGAITDTFLNCYIVKDVNLCTMFLHIADAGYSTTAAATTTANFTVPANFGHYGATPGNYQILISYNGAQVNSCFHISGTSVNIYASVNMADYSSGTACGFAQSTILQWYS